MNKQRFTLGYVGLVYTAMFFYGASIQAIGVVISQIIEHYGIMMSEAGLLSSFRSAGNFISIFIVTLLAGRINKSILMGGAVIFYAVSLCMVSTSPPFGVLLLSFSLIGVFGATTDTLSNSLTADFLPNNRSLNMSLLHGIYGLGGISGPIVIERLSGVLSWSQVYFAFGMAFFLFALAYALFLRWQWDLISIRMSASRQTRFGFYDIVQFFRRRQNLLLWMSMFFYCGNQSTMNVWIKRYVEIHLGIPVWGAYTLSAMWLGIAISRLVVANVIKASTPQKVWVGSFIAGIALIAGLLSRSVAGITLASFIVGLGSGFTIPLLVAQSCEWYPDKTVFGTLLPYMGLYVSYVVFPPLSGLVSDLLGLPWGITITALCALATALFSFMLCKPAKA